MVAEVVMTAIYFVEHQIPLFLLTLGVLLLGFSFLVKGAGEIVAMPLGVLAIAGSVAWFTMTGGSILALPIDVMEVIGIGLVFVVVAKAFSIV